jgi:hypothetical protein
MRSFQWERFIKTIKIKESATMTTQLKNEITTLKEAIATANEIVRLEAAVKTMKENLKVFVDANGSVEASDQVWSYSESISWKFKDTALKELATMMALDGHNAWELLSLSSTALKKLGWQEEFLSKYGKKSVSKRFGSKKK